MRNWMVTVRGERSEWGLRVTEETARAMIEDGFEAVEVGYMVPWWVVGLGLGPLWIFAVDLWRWPARGWPKS